MPIWYDVPNSELSGSVTVWDSGDTSWDLGTTIWDGDFDQAWTDVTFPEDSQ